MNTTTEEYFGLDQFAATVTYWIEGVGILAVGTIGLVINLIALWILFKKQVRILYSPFVSLFMYIILTLEELGLGIGLQFNSSTLKLICFSGEEEFPYADVLLGHL